MDFGPLVRHRDYRWLFAAQFVSFMGSMVTYVALPYQVYRLTGSSFAVGLLGLAELVPLLTTAFIGGAVADAFDRRRVVLATDVGLAVGCAVLLANALRARPLVWPLFVAAGWMSALSGLQRPSLEAITPRLVDKAELSAVATLSTLRVSIGMIGGPAIGGMLLASVGVASTYVVDLATYVFSFLAIGAIRALPPPEGAENPSLERLREGFRYARSRQELIGTYVVDFVAMVFGMPLALFPALSDQLGGPRVLGLLYTAPAVGALIATLTGRWTARVHRHGLGVMLAATVWGIGIVAFGFSRSLWPALAFLALAGGADCVSGIFRSTLWNQTIPDALRGRLAGIEMVSYMSGPLLGHVEAGGVAAAFGVRASVISGGVLCIVGVLVCGAALPLFVAYDARRFSRGLSGPAAGAG
jgi:MFS family permease